MAKEFSPEFWLGKSKRKSIGCNFDPMERLFRDKFGVDTFTFVSGLYSFSGCQWEVDNAYAYLQEQMDIIFKDMRIKYDEWINVDSNPFMYSQFSQLTAERSPQLAVPTSAVG